MKEKKILAAIGNIDDGLIAGAGSDVLPSETKQKSKFKVWMRVMSAAACLCIAVIVMIGVLSPGNKTTDWPLKELPKTNPAGGESALVPKWDEMTISQQFAGVKIGEIDYCSRYSAVPSDKVGEHIGEATLSGYDIYTDTTYSKKADIYRISGVSEDCAIAVCFEWQNEYYSYTNSFYMPATLGQFIDDLNLHDNIGFGSVWYDWEKPSGDNATVEFIGLSEKTVWEMLLSDTTLATVEKYDALAYTRVMSISVDVPLLGYSNVSLSVTEEGYLTTNILDTGKAFFIGKDKVEQFRDYVINNCEGHEIVWVTGGELIPE